MSLTFYLICRSKSKIPHPQPFSFRKEKGARPSIKKAFLTLSFLKERVARDEPGELSLASL